ncbi:MAG: phosphopantothenate/pantothenate synthetase [Spirochaetales bacterium]|nr:phosphopantothenate/pantothenate synthetase [Spirochaetales bacterium]
MPHDIPESHPRRISLLTRDKLISGFDNKLVATAGLIAHGRGEAFDYLLGEVTTKPAQESIEAAAALLLSAENAVVSVNGNVAALTPKQVVTLAGLTSAAVEVNLFYRSLKREHAIREVLMAAGAEQVLGVGKAASASIPNLESERGKVDPRGIEKADVVLVALEDGDRTEHLVKLGKKVIAIDLNPFSRTAQYAQISIVDNLVRAMPALIKKAQEFLVKKFSQQDLEKKVKAYNNKKTLGKSIALINQRLTDLARKGVFL